MGYVKTKTFLEIFENATAFKNNFTSSSFSRYIPAPSATTPDYLGMLFDLLAARYGTTQIANKTDWMFKSSINSIIFMYGPTWIKQLETQEKIRALTDDQLRLGTTSKSTSGFNPSTIPSGPNSGDTEIDTVNQQNLLKYTKSPLDGYATLLELLKTDVTKLFLDKFKHLFMITVDLNDSYEDYLGD